MAKKNEIELKAIAEKLVRFKEDRNISFQELARMIGIDRSHLFRIISLENWPSFKTLIKSAEILKVQPHSLLIPSQELLISELRNELNKRIILLKSGVTELYERLNIPADRLTAIAGGKAYPTCKELTAIGEVLDIPVHRYSLDSRYNSLYCLLLDCGLTEERAKHILNYVKEKAT